MIIIKKDFDDYLHKKALSNNGHACSDIIYIHKYDRQRLKSLLNEQMSKENIQIIFMKETK